MTEIVTDEPLYMRPEEVARELGFSVKALQNRRARGEGPPYVMIFNRIRYDRFQFRQWLAAQEGDRPL